MITHATHTVCHNYYSQELHLHLLEQLFTDCN